MFKKKKDVRLVGGIVIRAKIRDREKRPVCILTSQKYNRLAPFCLQENLKSYFYDNNKNLLKSASSIRAENNSKNSIFRRQVVRPGKFVVVFFFGIRNRKINKYRQKILTI